MATTSDRRTKPRASGIRLQAAAMFAIEACPRLPSAVHTYCFIGEGKDNSGRKHAATGMQAAGRDKLSLEKRRSPNLRGRQTLRHIGATAQEARERGSQSFDIRSQSMQVRGKKRHSHALLAQAVFLLRCEVLQPICWGSTKAARLFFKCRVNTTSVPLLSVRAGAKLSPTPLFRRKHSRRT